jgi:hypothetical protein
MGHQDAGDDEGPQGDLLRVTGDHHVPLLIERIDGGKVRHHRQYSPMAEVDTRFDGYG